MATISWVNQNNGNWSDGDNWSTGVEPGSSDDVILGQPGQPYVVTLDIADSIHSLTMSDAYVEFDIEYALSITTTLAVNAGSLALEQGGVLSGGTLAVAATASALSLGGTLSGVALHGSLSIKGAGYSLTLAGADSFAGVGGTGVGTISFIAGNYASSYLYVDGTATLSNVTINIGTYNGNNGTDTIYNNDTTGNGATLTLASTAAINQTGQAAGIGGTDNASDAIINKGTINANYYGGLFQIDTTRFTNSGTIAVSNGDLLNLTGPISTALIDSIQNAGGGEIRVSGTLNNTGNTLTVANGGELGIDNVITGGTLVSANGGAGVFNSFNGDYGNENGTLSGVAVQGTLSIAGAATSLTLMNGTTLAGAGGTSIATINFIQDNYGSSYLYVVGTTTFSNAIFNIGTYYTSNGTDYLYNNDASGNGATLTLASTVTINQTGQAAGLGGTDNASDAIINQGTINANYYGGLFQIDTTRFTNSGTIAVSNGDLLNLTGPISTTLIDSIHNAGGGEIRVSGTLNNTGNTLTVANGGELGIDNVITGGTLVSANGGAGVFNSFNGDYGNENGTLSGVAVQGTLSIAGAGTSLTLMNGTTLAGTGGTGIATINFIQDNYGSSYLYVAGTTTFSNVTFNIGTFYTSNGIDYLYNNDTSGNGATLTLASTVTINQTGQAAGLGGTDNASDAIINKGTINANYYGGLFQLDATRLTNSGTIAVSNNDLLNLTGPISTALIDSIQNAGGGEIRVSGTLNNTGNTLTVANGGELGIDNVITGGTLVSANGGAGVFNSFNGDYGSDNGTLSGVAVQGTLSIAGASTSLTLMNGTTLAGSGGGGAATINFIQENYGSSYLFLDGTATLSNALVEIGTYNTNNGTDYIYNNDTTGQGALLTLGSSLFINQSGQTAAITGSNANSSDAVINDGTVNAAYNGGTFLIDPLNFTNNGTLAVMNGDTLSLSTNFTNFSNTTLFGGAIQVGQNGTFELNTNETITTLAASVSLSGTNSTLQSLNSTTGTQTTFDSTFATIATKGTLSLLAGRNLTAASKILDLGTLALGNTTLTATAGLSLDSTGNLDGYGTVAGNVTDSGTISASGGTLIFAGVLSGTGTLGATAGGTVDLTQGGALGELIQGAGKLQLDGTTAYTLAGPTIVLGAISIDSGASFSGTGALDAAVIDIGTLAATSGTLQVAGAISGAGALTAASATVLDLAGGGSIAGTVSGAGTLQIDGAAALALNGTALKIAAVNVDAGATLAFSRGGALSGTVTGAGTIQLGGVTPYTLAGGTETIGAINLLAGSKLSGTGTLTGALADAGTLVANAGTLAIKGALHGGGAVQAASGGVLDLYGGGSLTGQVSGAGTLKLDGSTPLAMAGDTLSMVALAVDAGATLSGYGTISGTTTDTGTLAATGGSLSITGALSGTGALVANAGTVLDLFAGGTLSEAISGGGLLKLDSGTYTLAGGSIGAGILAIDAGATLSGYGSITGSTLLSGAAAATSHTLSFGTLSGTGSLSAAAGATVSLSGGGALTEQITGAGTLSLGGATPYSLAGGTIGIATLLLATGTTLSGSGTLAGAVIDGGSLAATGGTLAVSGALSGTGSLGAASGALLDLAGGGAINGVSGAGTLKLDSAGYTLSGGTIAAASLSVDAGAGLTGIGTISAATLDAGSIAAGAGTLLVSGALTGTGSLSAASGGMIVLSAGGSLTEAVSGAGTLLLSGGTSTLGTLGLAIADVAIAAGAVLSGTGSIAGAVQNAGTLDATSATLSVGGALTGAGTLVSAAGATLDLLGGGTLRAASGAGTLKLDGTAGFSLATGTIADAALLVDAGASLSGAGTLSATVTNAGTLIASGGTLKLTKAASGAGLLQAASAATLDLAAGGIINSAASGAGTLELGASTVLGTTLPSIAHILIDATGSLKGTGLLAASITAAGSIAATSGTLRLSGAVTTTGSLLAASAAVLDLAGGGNITGDLLTGSGTVEIASSLGINGAVGFSAGHVLITAAITTAANATITQAASSLVTLSAAAGTAVVFGGNAGSGYSNAGTLLASGTGTFTLSTAGFTNTGLISANAGTLSFLGAVTNTGTMLAGGGLLELSQTLAGAGTLQLGAGGIAALADGAAAGQIVDFMAATGALDLATPTAFAATIDGFAGSDVIDLVNTAETGFSYAAGVLTVTNGSTTVASLHFGGSYVLGDFALNPDGNGGTAITFV